jgi:predicted anti-sigma-YlaC factor YlaD
MKLHLSQDELLDQVYGVGSKDAHLRTCAECSGRLDALLRTKAQLRAQADPSATIPNEFLAAQRRSIYSRLDQAAASHVRWAPALAGMGLLAMGVLLFPHAQVRVARTPAPTPRVELTTNQLFSDLYSKEQSLEPSAEAPLHELFEQGSGAEEQ